MKSSLFAQPVRRDRGLFWRSRRAWIAAVVLVLVACAAPPPPPPQRLQAPSATVAFDAAINFAVDDLLSQAQRLPDFQPPEKSLVESVLQKDKPVARSKFVVDVALDSQTGQQTVGTRFLDSRLLLRAKARFPQFEVVPIPVSLQPGKGLTNERYLLAATLTPLTSQGAETQARYRINISLTDLRSGFVLAQAAANATAADVDATPTNFYQDSPSLVRDRIVDGQIRTAQAKTGSEADAIYVSSLTVSALISEGARLYDAGQFDESLRVYETAVARPDGKQLRVFNGLYLTNKQLGRAEAAEQAFGRIVALGLSANSLSFKFLFKPASTDFLADPTITGPYEMWLRVLAREMANTQHCVTVLGHSSRTGSEPVNERLSLMRATGIQRKLELLVPTLAGRLQSVGMGFRENLIGSGTDDLRDALDRRVEFRVRNCD
ncbi:MAG: OmpA family protein [Rhodoferax sp.]|jgi:outer membrane protein OmpA-like peptidoglycan-associated protein|nr:OmpA family protein [Rhodoferax sp.]